MSLGSLEREAEAYAVKRYDRVRTEFEQADTGRVLERLLAAAPGTRVLDLGCGDGLVASLAGDRLERYLGVDLFPPDSLGSAPAAEFGVADLRDGLGDVLDERFDLYLGTFGLGSHLAPEEFRSLVAEIAEHARPGSIVALEALGVYSLEWPSLWSTPVGEARTLEYQLAGTTTVHPWSAAELGALFEAEGLRVTETRDSSIQFAPKVGPDGYWPGLPPLRASLNALLAGDDRLRAALAAPLPPLPAHPAAAVHHGLATQRALLANCPGFAPEDLARAAWNTDPALGGGWGHRLLVVGVVS